MAPKVKVLEVEAMALPTVAEEAMAAEGTLEVVTEGLEEEEEEEEAVAEASEMETGYAPTQVVGMLTSHGELNATNVELERRAVGHSQLARIVDMVVEGTGVTEAVVLEGEMAMVLKAAVVVTGRGTIMETKAYLVVMDRPMIMKSKLQLVVVVVQVVDMVMVVVAAKFQVTLRKLVIFMEVRQHLPEEIMVAIPMGIAGEVEEIMVETAGEAEEEIMVVVAHMGTAEDREVMIAMDLKKGQAILTLKGTLGEMMRGLEANMVAVQRQLKSSNVILIAGRHVITQEYTFRAFHQMSR